jgi:hypothetical protein
MVIERDRERVRGWWVREGEMMISSEVKKIVGEGDR